MINKGDVFLVTHSDWDGDHVHCVMRAVIQFDKRDIFRKYAEHLGELDTPRRFWNTKTTKAYISIWMQENGYAEEINYHTIDVSCMQQLEKE